MDMSEPQQPHVTGSRGLGPDRTPRVQSIDRAMVLLRAVAAADPEDSTAARLAEACDLNRATAWRILHTLEAHEMVSCSRETGRWSIGVAVVDLAQSAGTDTIIALARPRLEELSLRTGETAALAVLRLGALTYVDEVVPPALVAATWLGQEVPLHATSTGKVLLAFSDAPGVLRPVRGALERFTDTTLTSVSTLDEELEQVCRLGYATCRGEYESTAWGVSAPVFDNAGRLVAVLSIWGPGTRLTEARFPVLGPLVRESAAGLLARAPSPPGPVE
jgi:DNA-binding IclR family transcriptional regulator